MNKSDPCDMDLPKKSETHTEPLKTIAVNGCTMTLLGTAHVSKASADKVQELIATGQYDAVAVELCPSRHRVIVNPDAMARMDLFQVIKKGQASMVAASLALGAFQQRMAEQLGIEPGAEMRRDPSHLADPLAGRAQRAGQLLGADGNDCHDDDEQELARADI